jgi:hypothetical protein
LLRTDFFDSDSFFENEMRVKLEQSRLANAIPVSSPFGTVLVAGHRSLSFRATLKRPAIA